MLVRCNHTNDCFDTNCPHYEPHEAGVKYKCTEAGPCTIVTAFDGAVKVKCVEVPDAGKM